MRKTTLTLLVLTSLAAAAAAVGVTVTDGGSSPHARVGERFLPGLPAKANDVRELVLVRNADQATIRRDGEGWTFVERAGWPANPEHVRRVVVELAELRLVEPKTSKAELYPRLQVEDPKEKDAQSTRMTLKDAKGEILADVLIGKRRVDRLGGGRDSLYVRRVGEAQSWLAAGNVDITGELQRFLVRPLVSIPPERFREIVLTQPDGAQLTVRREKEDAPLQVVDLGEGKTVKDQDKLRKIATGFFSLDLDDVRERGFKTFPEAAAKAEYRTFDGLVLTVVTTEFDYRAWARYDVATTPEASEAVKAEAAALKAKLEPYEFELLGYKTAPYTTKRADLVE